MPKRKKQTSQENKLQKLLEIMVFAAVFIGGAVLLWNSSGGPIRTGRLFTLGNLGVLMLGVGGFRLQMLLFPNWIPRVTTSRKRTRFRGR